MAPKKSARRTAPPRVAPSRPAWLMVLVGLAVGVGLAVALSYAIRPRRSEAPPAAAPSEAARAQLDRGRQSLRAGRYRDGWLELEQARQLAPHSAEILHTHGQASLLLKHFDAAADSLRASLREEPDRVPVLVDLAYALRELGQLDEAVVVAERAAALAPNERPVQVLLGQNLLRANQAKRAAEVMEKVIAAGAADPGNYLALARARDLLGERDAADAAFREGIRRDPGFPLGRYWYAQYLLRAGRRDAAEKEIEAYRAANAIQVRLDRLEMRLQVDGQNSHVWSELAVARWERGNREGARQALDRARALAPDDPETKTAAEKMARPYPFADRR